jgi:hypothetical protein
MFTKEHRRIRNRQRRRQPINWAEVASGVFLSLFAGSFFLACLGVIYYAGA